MSEHVVDSGLIIKQPQQQTQDDTRYRVGVVVTCLNQFQMLSEALESVRTRHIWTPYIVPNWRENLGCSPAWNIGCKKAIEDGCDFMLIINDDILLAPTTVDALVEHLLKRPDCVLASACNKRGEMQPLEILNHPPVDEEAISENPDFSCFMIRPSTIEHVGWFDEGFKPAYFEDNDYHYRIILSGKQAEGTTRAPYYHYGSATQNSTPLGIVPGNRFEENRAYFVRKWGGVPQAEQWRTPFNDPNKTWKDM